jgi:hypothetical protein
MRRIMQAAHPIALADAKPRWSGLNRGCRAVMSIMPMAKQWRRGPFVEDAANRLLKLDRADGRALQDLVAATP